MNFSILVDMNLSPDWIPVLVATGHTAVHWSTIGDIRAFDPELAQWARHHEHILLTHDLDFGTILAQTHASRPSVIIIRADDPNATVLQNQVLAAVQQHAAELAAGALLIVDSLRSRVRILPI